MYTLLRSAVFSILPLAVFAITDAEALHSFTLAAAYAAHQEDRIGSLEPGKRADLILVDRDSFKIPEADIDDTRVLASWVGGEPVFLAKAGQ